MSFEVTKICRTCLGLDGILLSIYDNKGSVGNGCVADMLREIIKKEAKKSDGLPERVCLSCISEINRCYSFKMKCENSDRTLRQLLNIPKEPFVLTKHVFETELLSKTKTIESNSSSKDLNKEQINRKLLEENQNTKELCPTLFNDENDEITNEEQNSNNYSIVFTKYVQETENDQEMIIEEDNRKTSLLTYPSKETKCSMCPMSFVHNGNLKKHMIKVHNAEQTSAKPFLCNKGLKFSQDLINNRDEEEYELHLIEAIEDDISTQESQLIDAEKNVKGLRCPRCGALFATKPSLNIHIKLNKCTKPQFTCGDCFKVFISMNLLKEHMKNHKLFCETCGKNLDSELDLSKHHEEHESVNQKHQCSYCRKVFTMRSTLKDHMRIHTGEKPYVCDLCGKAFSQNANLKQHVMRHNKTKPFKCDKCHQAFVSKGELYAHLRSHNGDQPFRCDTCSSAFTTSSSLVKHKRIHTGERPYSCDFCPMRFTALNTLKNHRRTHTGEKPYKCKFCVRAFAQKSDCSIHMRKHTGERRYTCNVCDSKFHQLSLLRSHMKTHNYKSNHLEKVENQIEKLSPNLEITQIRDIAGEQDHSQVKITKAAIESENIKLNLDEIIRLNFDE